MEKDCYYKILNLKRNATPKEIKRAYKDMALLWHPDHNQDNIEIATEKFKKIGEAFGVLGNTERRLHYDRFGTKMTPSSQFQPKTSWPSPTHIHVNVNTATTNEKIRKLSEHLKQFTNPIPPKRANGSGSGGGGRRKKPRLDERKLPLTLEELYTGCQKRINISQKSNVEKIITIDVKAGWKDGTKITFEGEGINDATVKTKTVATKPIDLVFIVEELPHVFYQRQNNDLQCMAPISLCQALCGSSIGIDTLDGREVTIDFTDEIIDPNSIKIIAGEGMPITKTPVVATGGTKGNLIVKFSIEFPAPHSLSVEQKAQLKSILKYKI